MKFAFFTGTAFSRMRAKRFVRIAYSMALIEYGSHRTFFVDYRILEREHRMKATYKNLYLYLTINIFL